MSPDPPSDELVQVHVGRWLFVGEVVAGVPGAVGAAVSMTKVTVGDHAEVLPRVSLARSLTYQTPSVRLGVVKKLPLVVLDETPDANVALWLL